MRTIEHILGRPSLTQEHLKALRGVGLYNGMGTTDMNLDDILDLITEKVAKSGIYDESKEGNLCLDLSNLYARHDSDWFWKRGFIGSNLSLAWGHFQLLHWTPIWARIVIAWSIFYAVTFIEEAQNTYFNKNAN